MNKSQVKREITKAVKELKQQLIDGEYYPQSPSTKCVVAYPSGIIGVQDSAPGISWDEDCLTYLEINTSMLDEYIDEHLEDITNEEEKERVTETIINDLVDYQGDIKTSVEEIVKYLKDPKKYYDNEREIEEFYAS
jgi:hypothetical protein